VGFTAVYDACVLHPPSVRDLLVRLGRTGLFAARWSETILDEMVESILRRRPDIEPARLARTRHLMCEAVPDCLVTGYERLIDGLELPDPDDRHVLAAAIRANAQVIVTSNLSDFPAVQLDPYSIEAQSPDQFVLHLVDLAAATVAAVIAQQADALRNPPQTLGDLLDRLARNGLPRAVAGLREHLNP
jgi:predicted nucleic acid-binding protein